MPTRLLALLLSVLAPSTVLAQNVTEWSSETRTSLAFRVNAEALQKRLPAGWVSAPSTSPATPGANLNVTMMERVVVLDPQGKPLRTGTSRYMVFGVPARNTQTGQTNTIIISGISPEGAGAYGVYLQATTAALERTVTGEAEGHARVQETWSFAAASGERVDLRLTYRRGPVTKAHVDSVVRSGARPEFQRTYRIDQASDAVRSASTPDRVEQLSFKASGPALASIFDGTETLLGVTTIPFYVREISIP
ncbi:MAG: hypothetical protein AB7H96_17550 [Vicinamibacterales bacterium]